jgi:hypothetical protein
MQLDSRATASGGSKKTYLQGVPVLAGEGVLGLLLKTLLALGQSLVPVLMPAISITFPVLCVVSWGWVCG